MGLETSLGQLLRGRRVFEHVDAVAAEKRWGERVSGLGVARCIPGGPAVTVSAPQRAHSHISQVRTAHAGVLKMCARLAVAHWHKKLFWS